jgi:platelet-activating factor acetylhydrolase IB subunit alpha
LTRGSHKAIIAYLGVIKAPKTAGAFREEVPLSSNFDDATKTKYEGLLEKKWTSVVRLQKKVVSSEHDCKRRPLMSAGPRA